MFFTIFAWSIIVYPMSLLLTTHTSVAAEEMNSYGLEDLGPPSIFFPPDDGSSGNSLIVANSWTADASSSDGQLSQIPAVEYYGSLDGQTGLGRQLLVAETDGCHDEPQSNNNNQNRRRSSRLRRQLCPAAPPLLKTTGQDTTTTEQDAGGRQEESGGGGHNSEKIWPSEFYPDDLPTAKIPSRPSVKADLEKCDHEKYNTPVCDEGVDSSPNLASSTSEWTLPNCIPCTLVWWFSFPILSSLPPPPLKKKMKK